jgi:hypothetical protein
MVPFTDHNGHPATMSRDEFFSAGYQPLERNVEALSKRMRVHEIMDLYRVGIHAVQEVRVRLGVTDCLGSSRWSAEEDARLRWATSAKEASELTDRTESACRKRATALGFSFRGPDWQTWEDDLFLLGKSDAQIKEITERSYGAISRRRREGM